MQWCDVCCNGWTGMSVLVFVVMCCEGHAGGLEILGICLWNGYRECSGDIGILGVERFGSECSQE